MDKKIIGKALKKAGEMLDDEPSEQALAAEYQSCQQDNNAASSNYWTTTGIFITLSSVLLGILVAAIITTSEYFDTLESNTTITLSTQNYVSLIFASIMGIFVILIFSYLRLRLRRVRFLQQLNFERMREIENKLGLRKSWRVHGIDHWNTGKMEFDETITPKNKNMLLEYKPQEWWNKKRSGRTYAKGGPNSYNGIYGLLIFLWALLVTNALTLLKTIPITDTSTVVTTAFISGIITFIVIQFTRTRNEKNETT
jgi:hypothetical protein